MQARLVPSCAGGLMTMMMVHLGRDKVNGHNAVLYDTIFHVLFHEHNTRHA